MRNRLYELSEMECMTIRIALRHYAAIHRDLLENSVDKIEEQLHCDVVARVDRLYDKILGKDLK